MASCDMVNECSTFSPPIICCIQKRKFLYPPRTPDLVFTRFSATSTTVFDLLIARFLLVVLLSSIIITNKNGQPCVNFYGIQLLGDSSKDFHHSRHTKPIHSRKFFLEISCSSNCFCKEYKLCLYRVVHWKLFLVSTIWSQTIQNAQRGPASPTLWRRCSSSSICYNIESNELPRWYPFDIFRDHCVLVFKTLMQEAAESFQYPQLVREPLTLELK